MELVQYLSIKIQHVSFALRSHNPDNLSINRMVMNTFKESHNDGVEMFVIKKKKKKKKYQFYVCEKVTAFYFTIPPLSPPPIILFFKTMYFLW